MDNHYRGRAEARQLLGSGYVAQAQAIENGPKNDKSVVVAFPGTRDRFVLDQLSAEQQQNLREFDKLLFLSVIDPVMNLYRSRNHIESERLAREREHEFKLEVLPYCALAISRLINPYMVEVLLDPRPMCHHKEIAGTRVLDIGNLQTPVINSIRAIVERHYTKPEQFKLDNLSDPQKRLRKLREFKAHGVERAVLHKLRVTNWVAEAHVSMGAGPAA